MTGRPAQRPAAAPTRKTVAQVLYSGLGGHGSVAFSLVEAARAAAGPDLEWQNSMVFVGIEPLLPEYARRCAQDGIPAAHVAARQGKPWASWVPLYRALRRARPDAIVLHSVKTILPCWLYARRHGLPLVAVEHQTNGLKTRAEWAVSRVLMWLADTVVVLTPEYRAALQAGLGRAFRPGKVHVIPNGIDTRAFAPRPDGAQRRPPRRIGMAARFSAIKRHDLLIGALALLKAQDGADAWRLSLAGTGETLAGVQAQARAAGVAGMVEFPGFLGGDDLRDWFAGLDLYAHASAGETLSTSMLQAMAMGVPILGSDVPGITPLLAEGGGIGRVAAQTPEAFARGLRALADPAGDGAARARRARALAVGKYSQDVMFAAYRDCLHKAR
jgi:glycosyltransferase involved in cell wall biosynthesis